MTDAAYWIDRLRLEPHPEGGSFRETYRSPDRLDPGCLGGRYGGPRSASTAIYFLLTSESFSALHRLKSDELWFFHAGGPMTVHVIAPDGTYEGQTLGFDLDDGQRPQAIVPAGCWFGASVNHPDSFALVSCTVAPGFDFDDFEMGDREALSRQFPRHAALIERLTRP